jgi:hypothetical protein
VLFCITGDGVRQRSRLIRSALKTKLQHSPSRKRPKQDLRRHRAARSTPRRWRSGWRCGWPRPPAPPAVRPGLRPKRGLSAPGSPTNCASRWGWSRAVEKLIIEQVVVEGRRPVFSSYSAPRRVRSRWT